MDVQYNSFLIAFHLYLQLRRDLHYLNYTEELDWGSLTPGIYYQR